MSNYYYSSINKPKNMKRNARAFAAIILSGGMIGVTASPVFSSTDFNATSALTTGLKAPTIDVGTLEVKKGTVTIVR